MRIGLLREHVSIQSRVETPDDRLGQEVAWTETFSEACSVDDAWVRERLMAGGFLQAEKGSSILIHYREGIKTTMRAVISNGPYAGTYSIVGSLPVKARGSARIEALALACEKGAAP